MQETNLWKYCTTEHCKAMLLSFHLLEGEEWTDEKVISCLYALSNHTENHYTPIRVPKRSGGFRRILSPDPLLKTVQRNILHHILDGFTVSPSAFAYCRGTDISRNAARHVGKKMVLKLDIHNFFENITFPMVSQRAFSSLYFPPAVGTMLTALCCYRDYLPQGSPASPAISNLVMKPFDDYMEKWCGELGIEYSRYCDDMAFSGDFDEKMVLRKVRGFLEAMGFELNREKTRLLTKGFRQTVTGIVVNEKPSVSADYRRKLRQEVYFCEHFGVSAHLERTGQKKYLELGEAGERRYLQSLLGKIQFVLSVNPDDLWFREAKGRLMQKYGVDRE